MVNSYRKRILGRQARIRGKAEEEASELLPPTHIAPVAGYLEDQIPLVGCRDPLSGAMATWE